MIRNTTLSSAASSSHVPSSKTQTSRPYFGSTFAAAGIKSALEAGASGGAPKIGKLLKAFDFDEIGSTTVTQIKLFYAACIASRLAANYKRSLDTAKIKNTKPSYNEVRETAVRDSMGYLFWFFATPMIQRLFLLTPITPKQYRNALIRQVDKPETTQGMLGMLKRMNWYINPLARWEITSSQQVQDWAHQTFSAFVPKDSQHLLSPAGKPVGLFAKLKAFFSNPLKEQAQQILQVLERQDPGKREAFQKVATHYQSLLKFRNLATGVGMLISIALLGIAIPLWNIQVTKRNVAKSKAATAGH